MSETPQVDALRTALEQLQLSTAGSREALQKRLRRAVKRNAAVRNDTEAQLRSAERKTLRDAKPQPFDFYLVCDVEATCLSGSGFDHSNEIIELPVLLVRGNDRVLVGTFHRYVRPVLDPQLSDFCTSLTGITQTTVEKASVFSHVFDEFTTWLGTHVQDTDQCIFVTDGPWDVRDFFEKEFVYSQIARPSFMKKIVVHRF